VPLFPRQHRNNAAALASVLQRYPVDIVNSQSSRDRQALAWLVLTRRLRSPLVITRRQMPHTFVVENWLISRLASRIVAVSHAVGRALVRRGTPRNKLSIIHNGVVTDRLDMPVLPSSIEAWRKRIGWNSHQRVVGIVARPKDQAVVIQALKLVRTRVLLVLAGVDPSSELAKSTRQVPERHTVVCLPYDPEVRPLYELLDIALLPSRMEGFSQGLLEAMALGKPVIASAATGNVELVTDGKDGRLVPPLDPAAWAAAIEELLADRALSTRMGQAARVTAREEFSLEKTTKHTLAMYRSVLRQSD
jgi:glycosyltransferase involved in cell wall biosynthesis